MLRLFGIAIFLVIFFILSIPIYLIEWILSKCNVKARDNSSKFIVSMGFRICLFIAGVKIEATGVENIPKDKACLYVGNHNSFFDILVSYVTIPYNVGYVAKKEINKVPFLNLWMRNISCLFLDRDNIKEGLKTILKGVELTGTADIFENHFPKVKRGKVTIDFGKPIIIEELDKEDKKFLGAYTQSKIQEMLDERA